MKRLVFLTNLILILYAFTVTEALSYTLYEINVAEILSYDFDGTELDIPVILSGSDGTLLLFIVKTTEMDIPPWAQTTPPVSPESRFIDNLDSTIFISSLQASEAGETIVKWDGNDNDGIPVPVDIYRFYIFVYEPENIPESIESGGKDRAEIIEKSVDVASGLIMAEGWYQDYPIEHFNNVTKTPVSASIWIDHRNFDSFDTPITIGDEIGVFSPRGNLVGGEILYKRGSVLYITLSVYGDYPEIEEIDGMLEGEPFHFVIWDFQTGTELPAIASFASSDTLFSKDTVIKIEYLHVHGETSVLNFKKSPFLLLQNNPNPFNVSTTISYTIINPSHVTLTIYTITGQKVATLVDEPLSAGSHSVTFDGSHLASGIYLYTFRSKGFTKTGRMLLVK